MSEPLPLRANLEWLKKLSKERLDSLLAQDPTATLSDVQLAVAREFGFSSWRKLKAHVEEIRAQLDALVPPELLRNAAKEVVAQDDPGLVRLLSAVDMGETQVVAELLASRPALALAHGPQGQTALHVAAQRNDPQLAVLLIAYGADLRAKFGKSGHTPLSWAITCNALECGRELVRLGARPDLFCAAGLGLLDRVQAFFDEGGSLILDASRTGSSRYAANGSWLPCPPPLAGEQLSDALYIACRNGQVDVVRFLMSKKPDLSFRAYLGATPLHWAYFGGSHAIVQLLEQSGADQSARDDALRCTPRAFGICVPANWGFTFLVRARLRDDPTLVNFMDGWTSALHEAAKHNRTEVVKLLLENGASRSLQDGNGKTPLDLATEQGHSEVAKLFSENRSQ